jgi:hypothetical protein
MARAIGAPPSDGVDEVRVECVRCGAVAPVRLTLAERVVRARCRACTGEWSWTAATGGALVLDEGTPAGAGTPSERRAGVEGGADCPKCRTPTGGAACPACGLLRERFAGFAAARAGEPDLELERLWQAALAAWSEPGAHRAFLDRIASRGEFAEAAGRYRAELERRPGDPIATEQLARLGRMVQALMWVERPPSAGDEPTPYRGVTALFVVAVLAVLLLGGILVGLLRHRGDDAPPANATEERAPRLRRR